MNTTAQDQRFAVDENGCTYVVWSENRVVDQYGISLPGVYAQKLDKDGVPRWTNGGVLLSGILSTNKATPDVCVTSDGAIFTWIETQQVHLAKVMADGMITWQTYFNGNSGDCSNPRIAQRGNGAWIAFVDGGNGIQLNGCDGGGSLLGIVDIFNLKNSISTIDPRIVTAGDLSCYVTGRESNVFYAGHYDGNNVKSTSIVVPGNSISHDLAADILSSQNTPTQASYVFTNGSSVYAVKLYVSNGSLNCTPTSVNLNLYGVVASGGSYNSVCIAADSVLNTCSTWDDGAIIAWDNWKYVPFLGRNSHVVETQRVKWNLYWLDLEWYDINGPLPLVLAGEDVPMNVDTKPDIAWKVNADEDNIHGVVGWRDTRAVWCSDGPTFATQMVNYVDGPGNPVLWFYGGVSPSPQLPGVIQGDIQLERCPDPSGVAMISAYWIDTRAGSVVVGTKYDDDLDGTTHNMIVRKEPVRNSGKTASGFELFQSYPNPVSKSMHGSAVIGVYIEKECNVTVRLYDLLGRELLELYNGSMTVGRHELYFETSHLSALPAGVYRCELVAAGVHQARTMIITN